VPLSYRRRFLSEKWGTICPVTNLAGSPQFSAMFQGRVYLCKDPIALDQFVAWPLSFIQAPVQTPGKVIIVHDQNVDTIELMQLHSNLIIQNPHWKISKCDSAQENVNYPKKKDQWLWSADCSMSPELLLAAPEHVDTPRIVVLWEGNQSEEGTNELQSLQTWTNKCTELNIAYQMVSGSDSMAKILDVLDVVSENVDHLWSAPEEAQMELFGWSGEFCPVMLKDQKKKVKGNMELFEYVNGSVFVFASEECKEKFATLTSEYVVPSYGKCKDVVVVQGPSKSGNSTVSKQVGEQLGYKIITEADIESYLEAKKHKNEVEAQSEKFRSVTPPLESDSNDNEAEGETDAAQDTEIKDELVDEIVKEDPDVVRMDAISAILEDNETWNGVILECPFENENQIHLLLHEKYIQPSLVIQLQTQSETTLSRSMDEFVFTAPEPVVEPDDADEPVLSTPEELEQLEANAKEEFEQRILEVHAARSEISNRLVEIADESIKCVSVVVNMDGASGLAHPLRFIKARVTQSIKHAAIDSHRAITVNKVTAHWMIDHGLVHDVPMGPYCPVASMHQNRLVKGFQQMDPIVYNGRLYQPSSTTCANVFKTNPHLYCSSLEFPEKKRSGLTCAITSSCPDDITEYFQTQRGYLVFSVQDAMDYAKESVDTHSGKASSISELVKDSLSNATDAINVQVLSLCIQHFVNQHVVDQGWVITGFPLNEKLVFCLEESGILPDIFFHFQKPDFIGEEESIFELSLVKRAKIAYISSSQTPWNMRQDIARELEAAVCISDKASPPSICSAVQLFGGDLLAAALDDLQKEASGHCLVSFNNDQKLQLGVAGHVVVFESGLFRFADEIRLKKFQSDPSQYAALAEKLDSRLRDQPISPRQLLDMGFQSEYLEKTLSGVLCDALEVLGSHRFKHPSLSVGDSSLKFVALFLRTKSAGLSESCIRRRKEMFNIYSALSAGSVGGSAVRAIRSKNKINLQQETLNYFHQLLCQPPAVFRAKYGVN